MKAIRRNIIFVLEQSLINNGFWPPPRVASVMTLSQSSSMITQADFDFWLLNFSFWWFWVRINTSKEIGTLSNQRTELKSSKYNNLQFLNQTWNRLKVFYADDEEHEIISTLFHIHKDLDACLIRTAADISENVDQTPCLVKVHFR